MISVYQSTVADGSMLDRYDFEDAAVVQNRERYLQQHDIALDDCTRLGVSYDRDDFCRFMTIDASFKADGMRGKTTLIADGVVVKNKNHAVMLPVADCIAVTLYDSHNELFMLAHMGRHSLEQDGLVRAVAYLQSEHGSEPSTLEVYLSAAVGKDSYKIWALNNAGMKETAFQQLDKAGIVTDHIHDTPHETDTDEWYYSYSAFLKGLRPEDGDHCMVAILRD